MVDCFMVEMCRRGFESSEIYLSVPSIATYYSLLIFNIPSSRRDVFRSNRFTSMSSKLPTTVIDAFTTRNGSSKAIVNVFSGIV